MNNSELIAQVHYQYAVLCEEMQLIKDQLDCMTESIKTKEPGPRRDELENKIAHSKEQYYALKNSADSLAERIKQLKSETN